MKRARLCMLAMAAACFTLAIPLPGCALFDPGNDPGDDPRAEARAVLDTIQAERAAMADQLAGIRAELVAVQAAADAAENEGVASVAIDLAGRIDRGEAILARLDEGIANARAAIEAAPAYEDRAAQVMGDVAAGMRGAATVLPPPFGELVGLAGLLLGAGAATRERLKRTRASESVRELAKGLDALYDAEAAQTGVDSAERVWKTVQGQLSARTRRVIAATAEHPLGSGS